MLELLHDVTANAAVLTLLTGPRWAIGPRDLRLLKHRAAELAGRQVRAEGQTSPTQLQRDRRRHRPRRAARADRCARRSR